MKGRISARLDQLLKDPQGREQLKNRLLRGEDGRIVGSNKTYVLKVDVTTTTAVKPKSG